MSLDDALDHAFDGALIQREGWSDPIWLVSHDIFMRPILSAPLDEEDLFAEDWIVAGSIQ